MRHRFGVQDANFFITGDELCTWYCPRSMGIQNENRDFHTDLIHYYKPPIERSAESFRRPKFLQALKLLKPQALVKGGCVFNFIFADSEEKVDGTIV